MADNVPITAGSGTNIATDDAGAGGHVQIIKLAISTDGSATVIPADATNGLMVNNATSLRSSTVTRANVAGAASSTTLLASNSARKKFVMYNDSTADCYVCYGAAVASTTNFTYLLPSYGTLEEMEYTGEVRGIWGSATGNMRVTDIG